MTILLIRCSSGSATLPKVLRASSSSSSKTTTWVVTSRIRHQAGFLRRFLSDESRPIMATSVLSSTEPISSSIVREEKIKATTKRDTKKEQSKWMAYSDLAKAKLSALVVTTTAAGFVAAGGPFSDQAGVAAACIVGTALCSSSAAGWNQILEVDRDSRMKRTQQRPLVQGTLTTTEASIAATSWGVMGTSLLALGTDPVTATLGFSNILLYSGLYTYMKPRSVYNTWVGAVVGAIPPIMGYTAATGGVLMDWNVLLLGSALYLWQMPHFFALSYMHRIDYKRGGFAMIPVLEGEAGEETSNIILRYAAYLSAVPIAATITGVTSPMFALEGVALNSYALYVAYRFRQERTNANARKVFLTSLWYLPSWLMLYLLHSKVWDDETTQDDKIRDALVRMIHTIREQGRHVCLHEHAIAQHEDPAVAECGCPITLGRKKTVQVMQAAKESIQVIQTNTNTTTPEP